MITIILRWFCMQRLTSLIFGIALLGTLFTCAGTGNQGMLLPSVKDVAAKTLPSVVKVDVVETVDRKPGTDNPAPFFDFFFDNPDDPGRKRDYQNESLGSGVIVRKINATYYVLTNAHVAGNADTIRITTDEGKEFSSKLIGKDPRRDLALLKFESDEALPVVVSGNSDALSVGDWVLAIGTPYGFQSTVTLGIVSALNRKGGPGDTITDFIQTDAAINKGNSGGALLNMKGELVGINTWISSQSGGSIGLGFAVPVKQTIKVVNDLIQYGEIKTAWLGVSMFSLDKTLSQSFLGSEKRGVLVSSLYLDSPAYKAGVRAGDVLVSMNGSTLKESDDLVLAVSNMEISVVIKLGVIRKNQLIEIAVQLEERKDDQKLAKENVRIWPGFAVYPVTDTLRKEMDITQNIDGMLVRQVIAGSNAERSGLSFGDILAEMNGIKVKDLMTFYRILETQPKDTALVMKVFKAGKEKQISLLLPQ